MADPDPQMDANNPENSLEAHNALKAKHAALQAAYDELKKKSESTEDKMAAMEKSIEEMKNKEASRQASDEERDKEERHKMAAQIVENQIKAEKVKQEDMEDKIKELELQDAKVLQAMLPFAEGEAKEHLQAKQAKQALLENAHKGGIGYSPDPPADIRQAASQPTEHQQVASFARSFRSGLYS